MKRESYLLFNFWAKLSLVSIFVFLMLGCQNDSKNNMEEKEIKPTEQINTSQKENSSESKSNNLNTKTINDSTINYSELAKTVCDCSQASIEYSNKLKEIQDEGKVEEFRELLIAAPKYFRDALDCSRRAKDKQSTDADIDPQKLIRQFDRICKGMPKRMRKEIAEKIANFPVSNEQF